MADDKPSPPVNVSLAGMSKEEKEKEMARRREERKAVSDEGPPSPGFDLTSLLAFLSALQP